MEMHGKTEQHVSNALLVIRNKILTLWIVNVFQEIHFKETNNEAHSQQTP